jgi:Beta-propeller repeat/FG-GAP-like repeat/Ser-Thr-rich glycosyl-phosphatidyl-inositol-anchored membrane family/FG-GAP repeat
MSICTRLAIKLCTFISVLVLLLLPATHRASFATAEQTSIPMSSPTALESRAATGYGKLPLSFVLNAGQSDAVVRYQAHAMGGVLFFEDDGVMLSLPTTDRGLQSEDQTRSVVHLRFDGTDNLHRLVNAERLPGIVNYFIGNEPSRWLTNLPTYAGIVYEQLYPGIDLRYDGAQMTLKGTYILAPHADPSRIRWHYEGATKVRVDEQSGDLLIALGEAATLIERAPSAWQTMDGVRVGVTVRYEAMEDGGIHFALGDYDANAPLTIDPQLIYSTYLGGSAFDGAKSVAIDFAGNAYITGVTQSTNFPTQSPIYNALNGDKDAFIVKINATGTALVYATYLGGSDREDDFGSERAGGIAVDSSGNAYVTGCTNSADFPTVNPIQGTHGLSSNCDVFVSKLNPAGDTLIYSTFLGGSGADSANAIAVDDQGSVYIAGDAGQGFPGDPFSSSTHVFVAKIDAAGSAVVFSIFLGGGSSEYATDVAVDSAHDIYVVGNSYSTDFPVLNPAQPTKGGGTSNNHDAFVTKIRADGSGLVYSTYLGGSKTDEAYGVAVDDLGNAYITGMTQSTNFPILNAYQPVYGGERGDAFVTKLSAAGNAFVYSTYLGGNNDENFLSGHGPYGGIAVDSFYNAYITGYTCSPNFPTLGSFRNGMSGTCFAFVTRFNAAGNTLVFSTLIGTQSGGSNDASGTDITLDPQGNVYVVGETNATDFLTMNPLQSSRGGLFDAFVTKLDPGFKLFLPLISRAPQQIATLQITSPNGTEQWQPGTTHNIRWTQSGLFGTVTIQLYKGASLSSQLGVAGATAGIYAWTIPSGQVISNDYKVRIFQGSVEDYSNANFSIVTIRKYDLLGSWSTGVSSLNSDTGAWNLITSSVATQIAAGDMDGDGIADLVGIFPASGLWVKYSATGQWQFISSPPTWITVGDFNGDGKADLAGIWGGVVWIRDSATGSWTNVPTSSAPTQIAAGDMDGDGKADLVVNLPATGVWVQYSSTGAWSNLSPSAATQIAVGDFNGDGKADLAGIWSNLIWLRDSSTWNWTAGAADATLIAAGDMNGDGNADLVANWPATGVWVQYSSTGTWSNLTTSPATWIATGILR